MWFGIVLFIGTLTVTIFNIPPKITTPQELAIYSKCDIPKISYWIYGNIEYKVQGNNWDSANICMKRKWGDCKCMAEVAKETIDLCKGYSANMVCMQTSPDCRHAVTLFEKDTGEKGYVNSWDNATFPKDTDWNVVIENIHGGPWKGY